jgi:glycosyltransferase involved in cell wall biosynthesis
VTSIGRVVVVGPASPAALASHLSERDSERAGAINGLGAPPVNALVTALLDRGVEVELVTLTPEVVDLQHLSGPGFEMRIGPYRSRPRHRAKDFYAHERRTISDLLLLAAGDVVHAHWTYEFALPCERERRPVLVTAHDAPLTILNLKRDAYRLARAALACRVRMGIRTLSAVSPYLAHRWCHEMAYRRPIIVVPNIATALPPGARRATAGRRVVLDISDHSKLKNVAALIQAFTEVRRQRPDTVLRLVGPGLGPNGELARWAKLNRLDTSVEFAGLVDHTTIPDHLAEADVFAHAALEEAHPMSMCEAMHAGLPIVGGQSSGGVPWTLDDGRCGLLVDVGDPDAIAGGILRLLADPGLATRLAIAAQRRADSTFGADAVTHAYLNAYATAAREQAVARRALRVGRRRGWQAV